MDTDSAIKMIRQQRQAFAFGVSGVDVLYNAGREEVDLRRPLRTSITQDIIHPEFLLPKVKMNTQLEQATTNRLAMQLVVGVGDAVKKSEPKWARHSEPIIKFLRQIRNGAAHNNRLNFGSAQDPRPNTEWRGFEITKSMEGETIFTELKDIMWESESVDMEVGFMEAGDAFQLTTDVLGFLIENSDKFGPEHIIGLSEDSTDGWEDL